jgi:hypothetical protein
VSKTFIPAYSQQSSAMHQELLRELRTEIHNVKKESIAWQNDTARGQEVRCSFLRLVDSSLTSTSSLVIDP